MKLKIKYFRKDKIMINNIKEIKAKFPIGARIKLIRMFDEQSPKAGTLGTIYGVDDIGTILVHWDDGRSLGLIYNLDQFILI